MAYRIGWVALYSAVHSTVTFGLESANTSRAGFDSRRELHRLTYPAAVDGDGLGHGALIVKPPIPRVWRLPMPASLSFEVTQATS